MADIKELKAEVYDLIIKRGDLQTQAAQLDQIIAQKAEEIRKMENASD